MSDNDDFLALNKTIGRHLRKARKHFGYSEAQMASLLDLSEASYKQNESGLNYPSAETFLILANQLGISMEWLLYGRGPMLLADLDKEKEKKKITTDFLTQEIEEMLFFMEQIPELRHSIIERLRKLKTDHQDLIRRELEKVEEEEKVIINIDDRE